MVIDLAKCVGCDSCTVACKAENRTPPGITYNVVLERETGAYPNVRLEALPRPCMQCENPPCVSVCPVQATYKGDDGIVVIDADRCIGCKYCTPRVLTARARPTRGRRTTLRCRRPIR
ncbi:hypothetical protein GPA_10170 [Gordonibacter pamelaeae 7-10-1-b]|uniref:4Fe-4S ferredoxin-type domain-containing protein n=2 Tax=Eggerthellaceae TaxID=1643826 RepID=D6E7Q2_9ACTN|nr:hypothetical protein GPA_10170 [Gordonibacter pamelaeae 7-10-1-b]